MVRVSFYPEYILKIGSFSLSNTLFCSILTSLILIFCCFLLKRIEILRLGIEILLRNLLNFISGILGSKEVSFSVFPLIATFFIFILSCNLLGLLPGFLGSIFLEKEGEKIFLFRSPNSDLNSTLALGLISIGAVQYYGIKFLGFKNYLKRFFNFLNPWKFILGIFDLISEFTKILSLSLRLFGNIFAGEVLLLIIGFLVPFFIPLPFLILELFVGVVQSFIFATLSLVFLNYSQMR